MKITIYLMGWISSGSLDWMEQIVSILLGFIRTWTIFLGFTGI